MKRILVLTLICLVGGYSSFAQSAASTSTPLKKVMELKMPDEDDLEKPGTRGASVAWHPVQKKYYAAFAGNTDYPLSVFDATGKRLSADEQTTMIDTRGLWFNPITQMISGNAYSEFGWFTYKLDPKGIPTDITIVKEGMNQPDAQSVGVYNPLTKQVMFLKGSEVLFYNTAAVLQDNTIPIHLGRKKADGVSEEEDLKTIPEDYNYTSFVYTGIKGQELGFLNTSNKTVELYDMKTGFWVRTLSLPDSAVTESSFNFAYTNGIYWLFNIEERTWFGYR